MNFIKIPEVILLLKMVERNTGIAFQSIKKLLEWTISIAYFISLPEGNNSSNLYTRRVLSSKR